MPQFQISPTTILVRRGRIGTPTGTGGTTYSDFDLEWLKKYGNRKPLFRDKPRKLRKRRRGGEEQSST